MVGCRISKDGRDPRRFGRRDTCGAGVSRDRYATHEVNYSFHPEARDELIEAVEFYESRRAGLGRDFAVEKPGYWLRRLHGESTD